MNKHFSVVRCGSAAIEREEKTLNSYRDDIDRTRWVTSQHVERLTMGSDFVPPRIVVSSIHLSSLYIVVVIVVVVVVVVVL